MKNIKKKLLILIAGMILIANSGYGQVFVEVRPQMPHYERSAAPSTNHIWIDEDWEAREGKYVFTGGHWAEPPAHGQRWVAGHWKEKKHKWIWDPGHWR